MYYLSMKIKVCCYGTKLMRLGYIFENSEEIDFQCWISQKDFNRYRNEFTGEEKWLHVIKNRVLFLVPGIFWRVQGYRADIYVLSQNGILVAFLFNQKNIVYVPNGYDFTVAPFPKMYLKLQNIKRPIDLFQKLIRSLIIRIRLKKIKRIWCPPFPVFLRVFEKLNRRDFINEYFPDPTHLNLSISDNIDMTTNLDSIDLSCDFLLFNPNRILLSYSPRRLESGHVKGTDISVMAFGKFLSITSLDSKMVLMDRGEPDIKLVKDLITELGIGNNIIWIKPKNNKTGLSRFEMSRMYEKSHLIFGEFGAGGFGLTTIEAAFFSKPIVCFADEKFTSSVFAFHPFLSSKIVSEITSHIYLLSASEESRLKYGALSRKWFDTYFSDEALKKFWTEKFLNLYRALN
jgi:hypothetical protein